jgi:hypothetical protein
LATTPILGIQEVAPTQLDKTTTMNDAILALEGALQDQLAVSFAAGNVTLSSAQYVGYQAFICSGQTANRTLSVPMSKRIFVVRNTSSSYTVQVTAGTGPTVTIATSSAAMIQCDGSTGLYGLAVGGPGPTGPTGPAGGAVVLPYTFNGTTTTNADPGTGMLALNNLTQNTATAIYLDNVGADTNTWTAVIAAMALSNSANKGFIRLFDLAAPTKWMIFTLSAVTAHTGYSELTVAVVSSSATNPFTNSELLSLSFSETGDIGSAVLLGTGSPSGGNNNDFYIDTASGNLYTKIAGVWTLEGNLTGPTGPTGAAPAWREGTGVPSSGLGANGDWYLDGSTGLVYSKASGSWTMQANLQGSMPYIVGSFSGTAPLSVSNQVILGHRFSANVLYPINFGAITPGPQSEGGCFTNANTGLVINIDKCPSASDPTSGGSWTTIGTMTVAASGHTVTFSTTGGTTQAYSLGDYMRWIVSTPDTTATNFFASLAAVRT